MTATICKSLIFLIISSGPVLCEEKCPETWSLTPFAVMTPSPIPVRANDDEVEALMRCANEGDANAQYTLGYLYYDGGAGIVRDYVSAIEWFTLAAEQWNDAAQLSLALLHQVSVGDVLEAYKWHIIYEYTMDSRTPVGNPTLDQLGLLMGGGFTDAMLHSQGMHLLEEQLTFEEEQVGQRLAAEWIELHRL